MVLSSTDIRFKRIMQQHLVEYSKGKGMPGHMGSKRITIQNLEVVRVDVENNVILVKGAVPGPKKSLVTLKETVKASK